MNAKSPYQVTSSCGQVWCHAYVIIPIRPNSFYTEEALKSFHGIDHYLCTCMKVAEVVNVKQAIPSSYKDYTLICSCRQLCTKPCVAWVSSSQIHCLFQVFVWEGKKGKPLEAHLSAVQTMSMQYFSCCSLFSLHYLRKKSFLHTRHSCLSLLIFFFSLHILCLVEICSTECCWTGYFLGYHSWQSRLTVSCETMRQCSVKDSWSQMTWDCVLALPLTNHMTLVPLSLSFLQFSNGNNINNI